VAVCAGITRGGERCTQSVKPGQQYCHRHDPALSEERKRAASKAGRARPSKVAAGLHALLEDLTNSVIDGELETSRGAVANQLIGTRIRLLEYERRLKELEELEERLATLEHAAEEQSKRSGHWQGA
jgi:flagellar motility protein MotE (MotC chaperone)